MTVESSLLTADESLRYARHLSLNDVGPSGQGKLKAASVLIIGLGGLGCPAAVYLAAAGVGRLILVDPDIVSLSNLQRQTLYGTSDVGELKVECASRRLRDLNPHVQIEAKAVAFSTLNARDLVKDCDIVLDGSDNFATRYLLNDACLLENRPFISGAIFRFESQLGLFNGSQSPDSRRSACYRCLYPEPPPIEASPGCAEVGVLGVLPGTTGLLMATETLKSILGIGSSLAGRLLFYDALGAEFRRLNFSRREECRACGPNARITLESGPSRASEHELSTEEFLRLYGDPIRAKSIVWIDVRSEAEYKSGHLTHTRNISLDKLKAAQIESDWEFVVLCKTGRRSARAIEILGERGISKARSLVGGLDGLGTGVDRLPK